MEHFSPLTSKIRHLVPFPHKGYLQDHRFLGRSVLPAVEAMQLLAESACAHFPKTFCGHIVDAHFERFLFLDSSEDGTALYSELEQNEAGDLYARLISRRRSPKASITREKCHVSLVWPRKSLDPLPTPIGMALEEAVFQVSCADLYAQLVPFGPAYQNLKETFLLSPDGALARMRSDKNIEPQHRPLGSSFALDAAFHAACAWGQRFLGQVMFPVGIKARQIFQPTLSDCDYSVRVIPITNTAKECRFDIWIMDVAGKPHEAALGVMMTDVSAGRLTPPEWIKIKDK